MTNGEKRYLGQHCAHFTHVARRFPIFCTTVYRQQKRPVNDDTHPLTGQKSQIKAAMPRRNGSMMEQSRAVEHHHHAVLVARLDHDIVADGAARLYDVARAALLGAVDAVAEREKGV